MATEYIPGFSHPPIDKLAVVQQKTYGVQLFPGWVASRVNADLCSSHRSKHPHVYLLLNKLTSMCSPVEAKHLAKWVSTALLYTAW